MFCIEVFCNSNIFFSNPFRLTITCSSRIKSTSIISARISLSKYFFAHYFSNQAFFSIRAIWFSRIRVKINHKRVFNTLNIDFLIKRIRAWEVVNYTPKAPTHTNSKIKRIVISCIGIALILNMTQYASNNFSYFFI